MALAYTNFCIGRDCIFDIVLFDVCYIPPIILWLFGIPSNDYDRTGIFWWLYLVRLFLSLYFEYKSVRCYNFLDKYSSGSFFLIKVSCPVGVAYSSALASALTFFFVSFYSMRVYKLPWLYFKKDFV